MALDLTITGIQHIGLPTRDISETIDFYTSLGFDLDWQTPDGKLVFLKYGDLLLECYEMADTCGKSGAINHICLDVTDAQAAFAAIQAAGCYKVIEKQVKKAPFYDHGMLLFNLVGPSGEKVEFNQKL